MEAVIKALAVTAEICGTDLSEGAVRVIVGDLSRYSESQVLDALTKCRREVKHKLTLADIITRIDDGRPTADQAWCMYPKDEYETACITTETSQAMQGIEQLLSQDEKGARFAFIRAYESLVQTNRNLGIPPEWKISLGWDREGREPVIMEALQLGRITPEKAQAALPHKPLPLPENVRKAIGNKPLNSGDTP